MNKIVDLICCMENKDLLNTVGVHYCNTDMLISFIHLQKYQLYQLIKEKIFNMIRMSNIQIKDLRNRTFYFAVVIYLVLFHIFD